MEDIFENLDALIDRNLSLIERSHNKFAFIFQFVDLNDNRLMGVNVSRLADFMEKEGLIELEFSKRQRADLTELGYTVIKHGGWLKYKELVKEEETKELFEQQKADIRNQKRERKETIKLNTDIARNYILIIIFMVSLLLNLLFIFGVIETKIELFK